MRTLNPDGELAFFKSRTECLLSVRHTAALSVVGGTDLIQEENIVHLSAAVGGGGGYGGPQGLGGAATLGRGAQGGDIRWSFHPEEGITCAQRHRPEAYKEQLRACFCFSQLSLLLFSFACLPLRRTD